MSGRALALFGLLLLGLGGGAAAETAVELGLDGLTDGAQEIVVGSVVQSRARWQGKLIVTQSRIRVDETLKGRPGAEIVVSQLGGTAVHPRTGLSISMSASGQALLREGQSVLLFVARRDGGPRLLLGGAQGRYVIRTDPDGTARIAVGPKTLEVLRERGRVGIAAEAISLDDMREKIRARVRARPAEEEAR